MDENVGYEYDPDQPMAERRVIQRGIRELISKTNENQDELLDAKSTLFKEILAESDTLIRSAKQTTEAAVDARLLLHVSELMNKRSIRWMSGNAGNGVDVDEFVSKCATYMRQGRGIGDDDAPQLSSTQRQRRVAGNRGAIGDDEDEEDEAGEMLNWSHFGRFACMPHSRRPAVPGFLLGPLSVEKKVRKAPQRTARLRINNLREVRPEVLQAEDLKKGEKDSLTALCKRILVRLDKVQTEAQSRVEAEYEDLDEEETKQLMYKYGLRRTGGVDFFRFVVNPHSFGQTIENMFYVSFLIRDGRVGIEYDEDELPALRKSQRYIASRGDIFTNSTIDIVAQEDTEAAAGSRRGATKHQAIMTLDMPTWREIIKVFGIKEPMIPHRVEESNSGPGARGWYS